MLTAYETRTQQLLQNPIASPPLYATTDVDGWVNQARGQLAGESKSIRRIGTLAVTAGTSVYPFTAINLNDTSVQGVLNVATIWVSYPNGQVWMRPRPFEWFSLFELNSPIYNQASKYATPKRWAQYGQGVDGTIYVSPVPDQPYTLNLDCVCYPITLVDDTTPEAIPYLWTDAVPYFAAYLALLSSQTGAREAQADRMFQRYEEFVSRARRFATPEVLPAIYPQNPNQTRQNQLGVQAAFGGTQAGGGGPT